MRREQGFTLVELLIAMTMFIIVIASVASVFAPLLTQFKQQSKSAETQIEGIIGLEILRRDIKHAGFGLPWIMNGGTYREAEVDGLTAWVDRDFNDGPPDNPARGTDVAGASNPPGAIRGDDVGLYNSDVLVLKAANVAINDASQKWTRLGAGDVKRNGPPDDLYDPLSGDAFENTDRVIVIFPGNSDATRRGLVLSPVSGSWKTTYDATSNFAPSDTTINIIYGIKLTGDDMRFPFNRTEYYIRIPTTSPMPNQCAAGTGILYKSALNHSNGQHNGSEDPLLDCVADFQVVYTTDTGALAREDNNNGLTAAQIRSQIRTVTVYILAQEGQKDPNFTFTGLGPAVYPEVCDTCIRVGPATNEGRSGGFNFAGRITDYLNYRWKVYTLTVTLENLG